MRPWVHHQDIAQHYLLVILSIPYPILLPRWQAYSRRGSSVLQNSNRILDRRAFNHIFSGACALARIVRSTYKLSDEKITRDDIERRLNAFFDDPENLNHLPLDDTDHLFDIRREADEGGMAVFAFSVRTKKRKGPAVRFKCNPSGVAFLMRAELLGASPFVDHNTKGNPYLKVCGGMRSSAGITAARIFAGHEEQEDTKHLNEDTRDLTHQNRGERYNPRTKRGRE